MFGLTTGVLGGHSPVTVWPQPTVPSVQVCWLCADVCAEHADVLACAGVCIHSVFIGYQTFPTILQRLSEGNAAPFCFCFGFGFGLVWF